MKLVFGIGALMLVAFQANADIYLRTGESIRLGRDRVYCGAGYSEPSYYCTIESSFDGSFSGTGRTKLEAQQNARNACKQGSRNNGFFCNDRTLTCQAQ